MQKNLTTYDYIVKHRELDELDARQRETSDVGNGLDVDRRHHKARGDLATLYGFDLSQIFFFKRILCRLWV